MTRFLAVLVSLLSLAPLGAEELYLDVEWADLAAATEGRAVEIVLPDSVLVKGHVRSLTADTLELDIRKTSDKRTHPKGPASLARSSVKTLRYTEIRGKWRGLGSAIGAGVGGAAGAVVAIPINNEGNSSRAAGFVAAAIGVGATAGFFAGRGADRRVTVIRIVD